MPLSSKLILQQPGTTQPPTSDEDFTHRKHEQRKPFPNLPAMANPSIRSIGHSKDLPQPPTDRILSSTACPHVKANDTNRSHHRKPTGGKSTSKKKTTIKFETKEK